MNPEDIDLSCIKIGSLVSVDDRVYPLEVCSIDSLEGKSYYYRDSWNIYEKCTYPEGAKTIKL